MTTWKASIARRNTPRVNIIREAAGVAECVEGCGGKWLACALEVLRDNGLHPIVFAEAVHDLLVRGGGGAEKHTHRRPGRWRENLHLGSTAKCIQYFSNPAGNRYSWLEVENAEVIFLNDFRWSPE